MYGKVWDIKSNTLKSQIVAFGSQQPNAIEITMEDSIIPWGGRVKYLGCYFSSPSGEVDLSQSPFPQLDIIRAMVIVWRARGKIIRSVLCNIVCNSCAQCNAHTYEQT